MQNWAYAVNTKIILSVIGFALIVLTQNAWADDHNGGRGFAESRVSGSGHAHRGAAFHCNRAAGLDYGTELPHGYLKVYSTKDEDNNGAYYSNSSYEIYSSNGRLFKRVEHNISRTDEIIPWEVPLSTGSYTIVGHSVVDGEVCVHFVIKTDERTIVALDLAEQEIYKRRFHVEYSTGSSHD